MSTDFAELHEMYRSNVFPAMVDVLARQLGVSSDSLVRLGIGWKITDACWMFPERDADGQIIGFVRRYWDGTKFCEKGSKRGLTFYATRTEAGYDASRQSWTRVTEAEPCPICGKPDWCGFDNAEPPRFARCMRVTEGSVHKDRGEGYIHELVPGAFKPPGKSSPLPPSDLPVLVVEGATDTAAAMDLGFVAVGRPSASGGIRQLGHLLHGRTVVVVGENDAGAGITGMEKTFEHLRVGLADVTKILPPPDSKDLRDWITKHGLTQADLLATIKQGNRDSDSDILETKAPLSIAELWLRTEKMRDGVPILRKYNGEWYQFDGQCYEAIDRDTQIRGPLYAFLKDKQVKKFSSRGELSIEPYEATRSKISDIVDALHMSCPVHDDPPCWLDLRSTPAPANLICFSNGILDIHTYTTTGQVNLLPPTPQLFSLTATPYSFSPEAKCPQWLKFLGEVFNNDAEQIALLQEWFGYNMVADTSMEKFMLFVGRPASGKSTTLEVMQALLGRDQFAKSSFKHLCSDFGLQPLIGKLAAIMPDAHVPRQVDATQALETIKAVVGRDGVTVNRKFLPQLPDCKLPCRFTIAVNELPELPDHARSLERRLVLLYFPVTFEGREDRTLKDRLPKEAPGIAVWALDGLRRLRQQDMFTAPKSSGPIIMEFRKFLTPIAEFIDECCESGIDRDLYWVPKNQIYDVWRHWAREHGLLPGVRSRFGQRLMAQLVSVTTGRKSFQGSQQYVYFGLRLTPNAKDRHLGRPGGIR